MALVSLSMRFFPTSRTRTDMARAYWIATRVKGRVCIDLDIDRQHATRFGTPEQIDGLIREEVEKLGSRDGGLMMIYGFYPGVPIENARAVMEAMERYAGFYA